MPRPFALPLAALLLAQVAPLHAQETPEGQDEADYVRWLGADPGRRAQVLSFESWQEVTGVKGVLPTWQVIRTASMWRECGGQPFEVPPFAFWPGMVKTLRFVRDRVIPAVGPVQAVSGYRNPALNACARGARSSAHLDFFALDLIPLRPTTRRQLFDEICPAHARWGRDSGIGLGFYQFTRFHVDARSFRRWGSAGPAGNQSPCAVLEQGGDPEAPPLTPPVVPVTTGPALPPPLPSPPSPSGDPKPDEPKSAQRP